MKNVEKKIIVILFSCLILCSCGPKEIFITSPEGEKQYKTEDGELVRNDWVEINEEKYHFDMNGNLQTSKWIDNEYYVDESGKMKKKDFYKDEENDETYYFASDGKYVRDTLITIGENDYYFDKNGCMIIDEIFESDFVDEQSNNKKMYADENGYINKSNNIVIIKDDGYFIDSDGFIFTGGWKEIEKKWYYFMNDGKMKKNEWFEATYYFADDGKMLTNDKSPEGYEVDKEGKILEKYKKYLVADDLQYLYENYCKYPWGEVASDGSYLSIDTNPHDYNLSKYPDLATEYLSDAIEAIKEINKIVGFSDYIYKKMSETTSSQGRQSEENGNIKIEWTYQQNAGLEVIYIKKEKEEK